MDSLEFGIEELGYNVIYLKRDAEEILFRINLKTEKDFEEYKNALCERVNFCFNVLKATPSPTRFIYRKMFICLFGDRRHKGKKKLFTGCKVRMDVKIRLVTKVTVQRDKMMGTHPCFIKITGSHNHSVESANALRHLRVLPKTKEEFYKYFDIGMSAAQAVRFHQDKLDFDLSALANCAINPSYRQVEHLRNVWLLTNHGEVGGHKMYEAIRRYAEDNPEVKILLEIDDTDPNRFCVILVTQFMIRIHKEFKESGEVVFVDTTSHVDSLNTAVTPILCASPAGAVPLGVIFTSGQDEKIYTKGFHLLKQALGQDAFYGKGFPLYFITDNSDAERNAIKSVWPRSELFLCIFHVLQHIWRWLWNATHGIKKEDRPRLMKVAQQLVYAQSAEIYSENWNSFIISPEATQYPQYHRYLEKLAEKKQDWCLAFRAGKLLRGHMTNNFAESNMCLIKDVILNRNKAYNTAQLIVYMSEIYDRFMKQRLVDVALGKRRHQRSGSLGTSHEKCEVTQVDELNFLVKSSRNVETYNVNMSIGICDCPAGQTGSVCKHQVACCDTFMLQLPQVFRSEPETRRWLAGVALGKQTSLDFFKDLMENCADEEVKEPICAIEEPLCSIEEPLCSSDPCSTIKLEVFDPYSDENAFVDSKNIRAPPCSTTKRSGDSDKDEVCDYLRQALDQYEDENTPEGIVKLKKTIKSIRSSNNLNAFLNSQGSATGMLTGAGRGKIPCQPTSVARRRPGMPRGLAPLGKGRKRKGAFTPREIKRPRNLALNVSQNVPNAKTH